MRTALDVIRTVTSAWHVNAALRAALGLEVRLYSDLRVDLLRLVGRDARVVIDVGANVGQAARIFSDLFPLADIYAAEPYPASYEILVAKNIPRVTARRTAIGATEGSAALNVNADSATNSLLQTNDEGRAYFAAQTAYRSTIDVPITQLDSFVSQENLDTIDLLKIDVQGAELAVLAGGKRTLQRARVVLTECNFVAPYDGGSLFGTVDAELRSAGFSYYNLYDLRQEPKSRRFVFGDALYVKASAT